MNEDIRKAFEVQMMLKGKEDLSWNGKIYTKPHVQTRWVWFRMGFLISGSKR